MNKWTSYYDLLGIGENASQDEIKHAFRKMALIHHPDKNQNSAESQTSFILLHNAYTILVDPKTRGEYDKCLQASRSFRAPSAPLPSSRTLPAMAGVGGRSLETLLGHLNFLLWEVEDLVGSLPSRTLAQSGLGYKSLLLKILIFLDKWILIPAGFPDYFSQARQRSAPDPAALLFSLLDDSKQPGHQPYVNIEDYFYNIRKRLDRFLEKVRLSDLFKTIPGQQVRLIDSLLEFQNYTVHCLDFLLQGDNPEHKEYQDFHFSQVCFYE